MLFQNYIELKRGKLQLFLLISQNVIEIQAQLDRNMSTLLRLFTKNFEKIFFQVHVKISSLPVTTARFAVRERLHMTSAAEGEKVSKC